MTSGGVVRGNFLVMKTPVVSYFYPLTVECPERQARAAEYGFELPDETQLCQDARPLYEGHIQPVTYCLGDVALKNWDDTNKAAMERQIELASGHGVDGFIFDTYLGEKNGRRVHEE